MSDATWKTLSERYNEKQLLDTLFTVGDYTMVAMYLNSVGAQLEAGWTGRLVVEIANLANLPLRVYVNEGIGQVVFLESDEQCDVSYEDRGGKYQGQTGLTYSRL